MNNKIKIVEWNASSIKGTFFNVFDNFSIVDWNQQDAYQKNKDIILKIFEKKI